MRDFGHLLGNGPVNANWYCSRCDGQCVACEHGECAVTVQRSFKYEIVFLSALEELSSAIQLRVRRAAVIAGPQHVAANYTWDIVTQLLTDALFGDANRRP
jgi:hypothetical protein